MDRWKDAEREERAHPTVHLSPPGDWSAKTSALEAQYGANAVRSYAWTHGGEFWTQICWDEGRWEAFCCLSENVFTRWKSTSRLPAQTVFSLLSPGFTGFYPGLPWFSAGFPVVFCGFPPVASIEGSAWLRSFLQQLHGTVQRWPGSAAAGAWVLGAGCGFGGVAVLCGCFVGFKGNLSLEEYVF